MNPSVALPQTQPDPITQASTGLADCGNWATSATWTVPATAVSGVYYALLERLDDPGENNFLLFVVRRDAASDILVQTSDMTWQAYNVYGGASLYKGTTVYRGTQGLLQPAHRSRRRRENDFFSAEYPLVRWLERNGYDVAYCTGLDVHERPLLLRNRRVFISSGHDEYVSGPQRANVEAAHDAGVNMMFLTGNEYFWKTRLEPSSLRGTFRTGHSSATRSRTTTPRPTPRRSGPEPGETGASVPRPTADGRRTISPASSSGA